MPQDAAGGMCRVLRDLTPGTCLKEAAEKLNGVISSLDMCEGTRNSFFIVTQCSQSSCCDQKSSDWSWRSFALVVFFFSVSNTWNPKLS